MTAFLNDLAVKRGVAAGTQNQALSALLFLYKEVLGRELAWLDGLERAKRPPRLPVVLTRAEVERLLAQLTGARWLLASLMYGSGLRVMECLRLRVKDVDLDYRQILVRDGKGEKDRVTMLPEKLVEPMRAHLERVRALHARDQCPHGHDADHPQQQFEHAERLHPLRPSTPRASDPRSRSRPLANRTVNARLFILHHRARSSPPR